MLWSFLLIAVDNFCFFPYKCLLLLLFRIWLLSLCDFVFCEVATKRLLAVFNDAFHLFFLDCFNCCVILFVAVLRKKETILMYCSLDMIFHCVWYSGVETPPKAVGNRAERDTCSKAATHVSVA